MPKSPPMTKQQRQVWWANFKAQQKREKKEEKDRIQLEKWEKYDAERRAKKEAKQAAPWERQEKEDDALLFASIKKIAPLSPMAFFSDPIKAILLNKQALYDDWIIGQAGAIVAREALQRSKNNHFSSVTDVDIDTPRQAQIRAIAAHSLSEQLYLSHIISSAILATNVDMPPTSTTEGDSSNAPAGTADHSAPVAIAGEVTPREADAEGEGGEEDELGDGDEQPGGNPDQESAAALPPSAVYLGGGIAEVDLVERHTKLQDAVRGIGVKTKDPQIKREARVALRVASICSNVAYAVNQRDNGMARVNSSFLYSTGVATSASRYLFERGETISRVGTRREVQAIAETKAARTRPQTSGDVDVPQGDEPSPDGSQPAQGSQPEQDSQPEQNSQLEQAFQLEQGVHSEQGSQQYEDLHAALQGNVGMSVEGDVGMGLQGDVEMGVE